MKNILKLLSFIILCSITLSCSKDNDDTPIAKKEEQSLILTVDLKTVMSGEEIKFTTRVGNEMIQNATITLIGGSVLSSNTWIANDIGTYKFIASKPGYINSNEIMVVVTPEENKLKGQGSFTYKGNTYVINTNTLFMEGIFADKDDAPIAGWILKSTNNKNKISALSLFFTPATKLSDETYNIEIPTTENLTNTMLSIYDDEINKEIAFSSKNIKIATVFGAVNSENILSGKFSTSAENINQASFSLNYEGELYYQENERKTANNLANKQTSFNYSKR